MNVLTKEQIHILRFAFRLRIEQMKKGKLDMNFYVESGKFHEDLEDAGIKGKIKYKTFNLIDALFKDELVKASFNPKYYEGM